MRLCERRIHSSYSSSRRLGLDPRRLRCASTACGGVNTCGGLGRAPPLSMQASRGIFYSTQRCMQSKGPSRAYRLGTQSVQAAFAQGEQSGYASGTAAGSVVLATAKAQAAAWQERAGMRGRTLPRDVHRPAPSPGNLPVPWVHRSGASRAEVLQQVALLQPTYPAAPFPAPEPIADAVPEAEANPAPPLAAPRRKVYASGPFRPTNTLTGAH